MIKNKMSKFDWCLNQRKGVTLIERNINISDAYIVDANDSLEAMLINKGKWKIVTGYYSCYNALYAIFMFVGIKSEIHDCTIELMNLFGFSNDEKLFIKKLKETRIGVQYYLKKPEPIDLMKIKTFVVLCKEIILKLDEEKINEIRGLVKND